MHAKARPSRSVGIKALSVLQTLTLANRLVVATKVSAYDRRDVKKMQSQRRAVFFTPRIDVV